MSTVAKELRILAEQISQLTMMAHVASIAGPAVNALCDYLTLRARVLELEAERDVRRMTGTPHHPEEGTR